MRPIRTVAYQSTDVARRAREVVDRARESSVLIRDKDGALLSLGLASDVEISARLVDLLAGLVCGLKRSIARLVPNGLSPHSGPLRGLSPDDDFHTFVIEFEEAALRSHHPGHQSVGCASPREPSSGYRPGGTGRGVSSRALAGSRHGSATSDS